MLTLHWGQSSGIQILFQDIKFFSMIVDVKDIDYFMHEWKDLKVRISAS